MALEAFNTTSFSEDDFEADCFWFKEFALLKEGIFQFNFEKK